MQQLKKKICLGHVDGTLESNLYLDVLKLIINYAWTPEMHYNIALTCKNFLNYVTSENFFLSKYSSLDTHNVKKLYQYVSSIKMASLLCDLRNDLGILRTKEIIRTSIKRSNINIRIGNSPISSFTIFLLKLTYCWNKLTFLENNTSENSFILDSALIQCLKINETNLSSTTLVNNPSWYCLSVSPILMMDERIDLDGICPAFLHSIIYEKLRSANIKNEITAQFLSIPFYVRRLIYSCEKISSNIFYGTNVVIRLLDKLSEFIFEGITLSSQEIWLNKLVYEIEEEDVHNLEFEHNPNIDNLSLIKLFEAMIITTSIPEETVMRIFDSYINIQYNKLLTIFIDKFIVILTRFVLRVITPFMINHSTNKFPNRPPEFFITWLTKWYNFDAYRNNENYVRYASLHFCEKVVEILYKTLKPSLCVEWNIPMPFGFIIDNCASVAEMIDIIKKYKNDKIIPYMLERRDIEIPMKIVTSPFWLQHTIEDADFVFQLIREAEQRDVPQTILCLEMLFSQEPLPSYPLSYESYNSDSNNISIFYVSFKYPKYIEKNNHILHAIVLDDGGNIPFYILLYIWHFLDYFDNDFCSFILRDNLILDLLFANACNCPKVSTYHQQAYNLLCRIITEFSVNKELYIENINPHCNKCSNQLLKS